MSQAAALIPRSPPEDPLLRAGEEVLGVGVGGGLETRSFGAGGCFFSGEGEGGAVGYCKITILYD